LIAVVGENRWSGALKDGRKEKKRGGDAMIVYALDIMRGQKEGE